MPLITVIDDTESIKLRIESGTVLLQTSRNGVLEEDRLKRAR